MPPQLSKIESTSFSSFIDAFLAMHRTGNAPDIEEAVKAFPEFEKEIRTTIPAMLALENAANVGREKVTLAAGDKIADCIIEKPIGSGAYGVVYKAYQESLNRFVAIKAIKFCQPGGGADSQRFFLESKINAKLSHPNIVPVYGFTRRDQEAFLIMKLIEGVTIEQMLNDTTNYKAKALLSGLRSDWKKLAEVGRDIAHGLAHAHAENLVHRDIKPSNLILDMKCHPWITDFGLAKIFDNSHSLSVTGDIIGTPRYMSPEQLRGQCDARSDIYSLGLTLYEVATGARAKDNETHFNNAQFCKTEKQVMEKANLPADLQQVIQKACAFSPNERYQSANELAIVFDRFLREKKPDRRVRTRKPDDQFRKEFRLKTLAMIFCSMLICGTATYFFLAKNDKAINENDATVRNNETNLIEAFVDDPANGFTDVIKDLARDSLTDASRDMGFNPSEKEMLIAHLNRFFEVQEHPGPQAEKIEMERLLHHFKRQNTGSFIRILYLTNTVNASGLAKHEKISATSTIRKFGFLVSSGEIAGESAQNWVDELSYGARLKLSELKYLQVPDQKLSEWLVRLESFLKKFEEPDSNLNSQIDNFFQGVSNELPPGMDGGLLSRTQSNANSPMSNQNGSASDNEDGSTGNSENLSLSPTDIEKIKEATQHLSPETQETIESLNRLLSH